MKPRGEKKKVAEFAAAVAARYTPQLHAYLLRRLRQPQDVDDLAQQVYLRVLHMNESTIVRKPLAYLYSIASHVLSEFKIASDYEQANVMVNTEALEEWAEVVENVLPAEPAERLNLEQQLDRALRELPPMQAAVLLLHKRDGLSYEEVAAELNLTVTQVHRYIKHAKYRLRQLVWER